MWSKVFLEKIDFWEGKLDGGLMADILFLFLFKYPTTIWCFLKTTSSRIRKSRYRVSTTSMDQETHVLLGRLFFFYYYFLTTPSLAPTAQETASKNNTSSAVIQTYRHPKPKLV